MDLGPVGSSSRGLALVAETGSALPLCGIYSSWLGCLVLVANCVDRHILHIMQPMGASLACYVCGVCLLP